MSNYLKHMSEKHKQKSNKIIQLFKFWLKNEYLHLILSLIGVTFISFSNILRNPFYYFSADNSELYFPWWVFISEKIHSLSLPFRNEFYMFGSAPFAPRGDPSVYYPIQWLFQFAVHATDNLNIAYFIFFFQQIFHYILGGFFFYLLMRKGLRISRWPSYVSSLTYILGGSFMARMVHPPLQYTLTWYPLLVLLYLLYLRHRKIMYALSDSVVMSLIIFSGHMQIVYYFLLFFMLIVLYSILIDNHKTKKETALVSFSIILLGVILSSVQLFPAFELTKYSARVSPETTISNLYNSLHPLYYLTLFVPKLFGRHQQGYWGSEYPWGNWDNFLYIGIIPVLFTIFSIKWKNKKLLFLFFLSLIIAFIFTLGRYWNVSAFINRNMPFSLALSWVNRMTMPFHFYLVVIAGVGAEIFISRKFRISKYIFIVLVLGALFGFLLLNYSGIDFTHSLQPAGRPPPNLLGYTMARESIYRSLVIFILSGTFMFVYLWKGNKIILAVITILFLLDIIPVGQEFNPIDQAYLTPQAMFGSNPQYDFIKNDRDIFRVDGLSPRNVGMVQQIQSIGGYSTGTSKVYQSIIPYINGEYPKLMDMANVKYIVSDGKNIPQDHFSQVYQDLWRNEFVLPRVFFVKNYKIFYSDTELIRELISNDFDPKNTILLKWNSPEPQLNQSEDKNSISTTVDITSYKSNSIEVNVNTSISGFLFLSEMQYPGWRAVVDGQVRELLPANLAFYALPIESGKHVVRFEFYSQSYQTGLKISLVSWFVTILLSFYLLFRKKIDERDKV